MKSKKRGRNCNNSGSMAGTALVVWYCVTRCCWSGCGPNPWPRHFQAGPQHSETNLELGLSAARSGDLDGLASPLKSIPPSLGERGRAGERERGGKVNGRAETRGGGTKKRGFATSER